MEVSEERWMTRGLVKLAFPLVSRWSSSSFTSMAAKREQEVSQKKHQYEKLASHAEYFPKLKMANLKAEQVLTHTVTPTQTRLQQAATSVFRVVCSWYVLDVRW